MSKQLTSHREMRVSTVLKVMKALQSGANSIRSIQHITGLSWGSCSEIITMLKEKKIIVSLKGKSEPQHKAGRKTTLIQFNPKQNLLFGMEIKESEISCSIINLGKTEIYSNTYPIKEELSNKTLFKIISSAFINCLIENSLKSENVLGLSLSLSGGIDFEDLIWLTTPRTKKIKNVNLKELYNILPNVRYITIEHDIHAQASSVMIHNKWKHQNTAFIHFGEGVGLSISNDKLYTGSRGFAGEIGHVPYPDKNHKNQCSCGNINCIETFLSDKALLQYINAAFKKNYKSLETADKSVLNHPKMVGHISDILTFTLVLVSNILDPETIIIGGQSIDPFYTALKPVMEKRLAEEAWLGGPKKLLWFKKEQNNCAFGSIYNSADGIIEKYVEENIE